MRRRRRELSDADRHLASRAIAARLSEALSFPRGAVVSAFWPLAGEPDLRDLLAELHACGARPALPRMTGPEKPLTMHAFAPGDPLEEGSFGVQEPLAKAEIVTPEIVLTPLLAFDRRGYRMGYGGGFYDRTLATLRRAGGRLLSVGVSFAFQEVDRVPTEHTDERLDLIVTDAECIDPRHKT